MVIYSHTITNPNAMMISSENTTCNKCLIKIIIEIYIQSARTTVVNSNCFE